MQPDRLRSNHSTTPSYNALKVAFDGPQVSMRNTHRGLQALPLLNVGERETGFMVSPFSAPFLVILPPAEIECPYDENSDEEISAIVQVVAQEIDVARDYLKSLNIRCDLATELSSQVMLRVRGTSRSLAKLDKAGQHWLIQTSPDSTPRLP